MAQRNIRTEGDEVLRKKCKAVAEITPHVIELLDDMIETLKKAGGVGLAAPQIGVLKRILIADDGNSIVELINPEFIEYGNEKVVQEGCLSVPDTYGEVRRPTYVKVKALNRNGEEIEIEGKDFLAHIISHEMDHLDGILFIDKVIKYVE